RTIRRMSRLPRRALPSEAARVGRDGEPAAARRVERCAARAPTRGARDALARSARRRPAARAAGALAGPILFAPEREGCRLRGATKIGVLWADAPARVKIASPNGGSQLLTVEVPVEALLRAA